MTSAGLALSIRVLRRDAPGLTKDQKLLLQLQLHTKLPFPTDCFHTLLGHNSTIIIHSTAFLYDYIHSGTTFWEHMKVLRLFKLC